MTGNMRTLKKEGVGEGGEGRRRWIMISFRVRRRKREEEQIAR